MSTEKETVVEFRARMDTSMAKGPPAVSKGKAAFLCMRYANHGASPAQVAWAYKYGNGPLDPWANDALVTDYIQAAVKAGVLRRTA